MPAPRIVAGLKQLLTRHVPFSQMAEADPEFLITHAEIVYFAPGETILAPSATPSAHLFVVKQGQVHGRRDADPEQIAFGGTVGDCFPVGALLADRPVCLTYAAVGDTFCLALPRGRFDELARRSRVFMDYCKRRLGSLLD